MKNSGMKASGLRSTLSFFVFLIIGLLITGFYFAQDQLHKYAIEIDQIGSSSKTDSDDPTATTQLQEDLDNNSVAAEKASIFVASAQDYQSRVTEDLNKYASTNSITITNFSFEKPAGVVASALMNGVQPNFVTITLKNPIPFTNLMQFIMAIESNLPKMQLMGIELDHSNIATSSINTKPLVIEVYTR